jgi:hypothetical protein
MIHNYDPSSIYHIFEVSDNSQKIKIGEIENGLFYDVDQKGKRVGNGLRFANSIAFWRQFNKISIKRTDRPLDGFESIAWGAYWTLSAIITAILVAVADGTGNQIFWLVASGIHFFITIRFRHNKYMTYWMLASSVVVLLIVYTAGKGKKELFRNEVY